MLQTTRTVFLAPLDEPDEEGRSHNVPLPPNAVGWGHFEPLSAIRTVSIYGDISVKAWRWTGTLPRGVEVTPQWKVEARVQGADRTFAIESATHVMSWELELREAA